MNLKDTVIRTSSWVLDILIGIYVIGFVALIVVFFVNGTGANSFTLILPAEDYTTWIDRPEIKAGPGMEEIFKVTEVRPTEHTMRIEFIDHRLYLIYIPSVIYVLIYFYIIVLLSKLVRSAKENNFFTYLNVKRLRIIGSVILISQAFNWLIAFLKGWFFDNYLVSTDITHSMSLSIGLPDVFSSRILIGLLILIISEAFAHGLKLKEEQDLTI